MAIVAMACMRAEGLRGRPQAEIRSFTRMSFVRPGAEVQGSVTVITWA